MPPVTTVQPYLPIKEALVSPQTGALTQVGLAWFQQQQSNIAAMASTINTVPGANLFTVATQPTLGAGDVGFVGLVTDYNHLVVWDGSAWQPYDAGSAYFAMLPVAPSSVGWQLCDGTATHYLHYGATLTESAFTTPDLVSTPSYLKSIAAYTGTVNGKVAPSSTGTGTTGTGTSGDESAHTHASGSLTAIVTADGVSTPEYVTSGGTAFHVQTGGTTAAGSAHNHSVPGLSVPALSIGTIEMANLGCLPYFRR